MRKHLQEKYALSEQGAKDLVKDILYSVLAYISLMLPGCASCLRVKFISLPIAKQYQVLRRRV